MIILITGGFGFIGNNLIDHILDKHQKTISIDKLIIYDRISYCSLVREEVLNDSKVVFIKGDICNKHELESVFKLYKIDIVIHLAAESSVSRSFYYFEEYLKTNINGSFNVIDLCNRYSVKKLLFMSTDEVYGDSCFKNYADESSGLFPTSPYASTKACSDILAQCYFKCFNLPVTIIRSNNVFGKYQHPEKIIPRFITLAMYERPCTIEGDGLNTRSYIFIDDLIDFFSFLLNNDCKGEIFNITSEYEISNIEIAKMINKAFNRDENAIVYVENRLCNDPCYKINSKKIQKTEWIQKTSFDVGLTKTIEWYKTNAKKYWTNEILSEYKIFL